MEASRWKHASAGRAESVPSKTNQGLRRDAGRHVLFRFQRHKLSQENENMKTFQTEAEVAAGGMLVLRELPFATGERVAVTVAARPAFPAMRSYAEQMAAGSGQFVEETELHVNERLLRETEW